MAPEKKAQEKMAQGINGSGKNWHKVHDRKNGTILFLLKTEINKFVKLYILLTKKMGKGRQKNKRSP